MYQKKYAYRSKNEDPKGRNALALAPSLVRAVGEHTEFSKTTETQCSQRKAMPF